MISRFDDQTGVPGVTIRYDWDSFNKLVAVSSEDINGPTNDAKQENSYLANGFRRKKKAKSGQVTTEYSAGLSTAMAKAGADTISYLQGHQILGFEKNDEFFFFLTDALGSVRDIVRGTDGAVLQSYDYRENGEKTIANPSGPESHKTWVGGLSVNDDTADSGLYLMGHRHYDASLGRFLSRDPIGIAGGLNLYSYANSAPIDSVDPAGLFSARGFVRGLVKGVAAFAVGAAVVGGALLIAPAAAPVIGVLGAAAGGVGLGMGLYEAGTGREHQWDGSGRTFNDEEYSESLGSTTALISSGGIFARHKLLSSKPCPEPVGSKLPYPMEQMLNAGRVPDRGGRTVAGRALQKHGARAGSVFPRAPGQSAADNAEGQAILATILGSRNQMVRPTTASGNTHVYDLPTGRGASFSPSGAMTGFVERLPLP